MRINTDEVSWSIIGKIIALIFGIMIAFLFFIGTLVWLANYALDYMEVQAFNEVNNTDYSYKEWSIHKYEIKELYPFEDNEGEKE